MSDPPQGAPVPSARGAWIALLVSVVVVSALRLHRLDLPLERDEGEYAYAAQLLRDGEFSYERLRTMKLPGTHAATAAIFALFGESKEALRGGLILVNASSMLLVFLLGRRMFGATVGAATAATFGVLALNREVLGLYAHAEHFALPPVLLGALLLQRVALSGERTALVMAGACLGLGIVMKQQAVAFLLFGIAVAAAPALWERPRDVGRGLRRTGLILGGAVLPLALVGMVFLVAGTFDSFWSCTVTLARGYTSSIGLGQGTGHLAEQSGRVFAGAPLVWLLALAGVAAMWFDASTRSQAPFLGSFAVASFLATCPGFYFREHYFVFVLPAAALFVGAAVCWAARAAAGALSATAFTAAQAGIAVLLLAVLASPAIGQKGYLISLEPDRVSRLVYMLNPFPEMVRVGNYLRERSRPNDQVAVMGSEPEALFYSGRRSPTGHIYMYPLMERSPHALKMQKQMIAEIEAARPRWVVSCGEWASWMILPDSHDAIIEWGARYTAEHYQLVGIAEVVSDTETVYRFDAEVASYAPTSERFVLVYERKD